jgi:hypothetical protein
MLMIASFGSLADEVTLSTVDGKQFTGEVISGTVNMLNIHKSDGGYTLVPRRSIASVGMAVEGGVVQGSFINWQDGRFTLRVDDNVVTVVDGVIEGEASEVVQPALQENVPAVEAFEIIEETAPGEDPLLPSEPIEHPTM